MANGNSGSRPPKEPTRAEALGQLATTNEELNKVRQEAGEIIQALRYELNEAYREVGQLSMRNKRQMEAIEELRGRLALYEPSRGPVELAAPVIESDPELELEHSDG